MTTTTATESTTKRDDRLSRLERQLERLEARLGATDGGPSNGSFDDDAPPRTSSLVETTYGSWSAADSYRLSSGATSEAMAAIEAKRRAALTAPTPSPAPPSAQSTPANGVSVPPLPRLSESEVRAALAAAIQEQLATVDLRELVVASLEEKLAQLEIDDLVLERLQALLDSDALVTSLADKISDGTLLGGRTPEDLARDLTRDAVQKVFDGEGASHLVEGALSRFLDGQRPEELVSAKVSELFDRFAGRLTRD